MLNKLWPTFFVNFLTFFFWSVFTSMIGNVLSISELYASQVPSRSRLKKSRGDHSRSRDIFRCHRLSRPTHLKTHQLTALYKNKIIIFITLL